jgi:RNA polymerase sigma-70 factor, ECF subfamily
VPQPSYEDFSRLYDSHARTLLAFFQRRVRDPELAVDLMAETFTLALERRSQYRGTTDAQLAGWLWAIAQSVLGLYERRRETERRHGPQLGTERTALTDEELERVDELAGNEQLRLAVAERMAQLPLDAQEAVRLRYVEDRSFEEIAQRLGITAAGVRTRVGRALRQLARKLQEDHDEARQP